MTLHRTPNPLSTFLLVGILLVSIGQGANQAAGFLQTRRNKSPNTQVKKNKPETPDQKRSSGSASTTDRNSLPLPKALLGHWVIENSETHYFYSESKFISVYAGKAHHIPYTIEEINEKERWMRLRITPLHSTTLTFSPDKNGISDIAEIANIKSEVAFIWKYVDNGSKPSPEILDKTSTGEATFEVTTAQEKPKFIIGDLRKKVYYAADCTDFDKVPLEKRVYFTTKKDAQQAGFKAVKDCP
jgi:hypothetical protein